MNIQKYFSFFVIVSLLLICSTVSATTYYVDATDGDDDAAGTSSGTAWQNLSKVNSTTFSAGDSILFQCGETWSGQLWPKGSGSNGSPITLSDYGDTNNGAPIINGGGAGRGAIYLYSQEYWAISDLEITNYSGSADDSYCGIYVTAEDVNVTGGNTLNYLHFSNLEIHNVDGDLTSKVSGGIIITLQGNDHAINWNDILVEDCYIYDVNRYAVSTFGQDAFSVRTTNDDGDWYAWTNVVVKNNTFEHTGGNTSVLRMCDGALFEYNVISNSTDEITGNAFYPFNSDNTIAQYNEIYATVYNSGDNECSALDADYQCHGTIFQYNYTHDNDGGAFVVVCSPDEGRFCDGTIIRYNIGENDSISSAYTWATIYRISGETDDTTIYNNTHYIGSGPSSSSILYHKQWGTGADGWSNDTKYYNNIFYNLSDRVYTFGSSTNNEFDSNIFYGNHPGSEPSDANKITSDPLFVNPGSGGLGLDSVDGYMLYADSPVIDAGIVIDGNNGGFDYWGNTVPYNGTPDIGAHEWSNDTNDAPVDANETIFADGFEDCFTNWTNGGAYCSTVSVYEGAKSAKFDNTESVTASISTSGYTNITVKYAVDTSDMQSGDSFTSEWYDGTSWNNMETISSGFSTWTEKEFIITDVDAEDNADFQLRFKVDNASSNFTYVDAVELTGIGEGGWTVLKNDGGFETDFGDWTDGGAECVRTNNSSKAHTGNFTSRFDGNGGEEADMPLTGTIDLDTAGYTTVRVDFWFWMSSYEDGDYFELKYHDGTDWNVVGSYYGSAYANGQLHHITLDIEESSYTFSSSSDFEFESEAANSNDKVYLDDIVISAN